MRACSTLSRRPAPLPLILARAIRVDLLAKASRGGGNAGPWHEAVFDSPRSGRVS